MIYDCRYLMKIEGRQEKDLFLNIFQENAWQRHPNVLTSAILVLETYYFYSCSRYVLQD